MTRHSRNNRLFAAALLSLLLFSFTGFAQKISGENSRVIYLAINEIKLRESPPVKGYVFISEPGKELATVKKGEEVIVLEKQVISTIFSKTIWVKVRKTDSASEGWAYWGKDENNSVNFKFK